MNLDQPEIRPIGSLCVVLKKDMASLKTLGRIKKKKIVCIIVSATKTSYQVYPVAFQSHGTDSILHTQASHLTDGSLDDQKKNLSTLMSLLEKRKPLNSETVLGVCKFVQNKNKFTLPQTIEEAEEKSESSEESEIQRPMGSVCTVLKSNLISFEDDGLSSNSAVCVVVSSTNVTYQVFPVGYKCELPYTILTDDATDCEDHMYSEQKDKLDRILSLLEEKRPFTAEVVLEVCRNVENIVTANIASESSGGDDDEKEERPHTREENENLFDSLDTSSSPVTKSAVKNVLFVKKLELDIHYHSSSATFLQKAMDIKNAELQLNVEHKDMQFFMNESEKLLEEFKRKLELVEKEAIHRLEKKLNDEDNGDKKKLKQEFKQLKATHESSWEWPEFSKTDEVIYVPIYNSEFHVEEKLSLLKGQYKRMTPTVIEVKDCSFKVNLPTGVPIWNEALETKPKDIVICADLSKVREYLRKVEAGKSVPEPKKGNGEYLLLRENGIFWKYACRIPSCTINYSTISTRNSHEKKLESGEAHFTWNKWVNEILEYFEKWVDN